MTLGDLGSRQAVLNAIAEYDQLGREDFLRKYGFGPAKEYVLIYEGKRYDSKAIAGAAHGFEFPEQGPLESNEFRGGERTVRQKLMALGFEVAKIGSLPAPILSPGTIYSWSELAEVFGFRPGYLGAAGGMVPLSAYGAILVVTHPGGGRSFDYEDYWDGETLMYAGRGLTGDQKLSGSNLDMALNRKELLVFQGAGTRQLQFLGSARCGRHYWAIGTDKKRNERRILRFVLQFQAGAGKAVAGRTVPSTAVPPYRRPRKFDPNRVPTPPSPGPRLATPEERSQMLEKASRGHHDLLVLLSATLERTGWSDIEEISGAIDLWARSGQQRVIFEAKTISSTNEASQVRHALSQLLEYRFFYGTETDDLCLVTDKPISDRRIRFFESLDIGVLCVEGGILIPLTNVPGLPVLVGLPATLAKVSV